MAYVVNELDSTVTACGYDSGSGALQPRQVLSALPQSYCGNSRAAGIQASADGRFVYTSNRGHDSIAVFAVDLASGLLRFVEAQPTGGRTPRFFTLSPDGAWLYALNEDSDTITRFAVDRASGTLTPTAGVTACASAVCMVFRSR
jgi:6-phosphogluconolactonase (cycloisomerase 2 family)